MKAAELRRGPHIGGRLGRSPAAEGIRGEPRAEGRHAPTQAAAARC